MADGVREFPPWSGGVVASPVEAVSLGRRRSCWPLKELDEPQDAQLAGLGAAAFAVKLKYLPGG